jgi:hypothetical protein
VNDPDYHVDDLAPYSPKKLYYSTVAKMPMQIRIWQERFKGVDPSRAGRNHDVDLLAILDHMTAVTTHISITKYLQAWDDASNCHLSQGGARISWAFRCGCAVCSSVIKASRALYQHGNRTRR